MIKSTAGIFDFPNVGGPGEVARWLEEKLVGADLARVASQLEALQGEAGGDDPDLDAILGGRLDDVLQSGLGVLPRQALSRLFRRPRRLLELQERVLIEGGFYWSEVIRADRELAASASKSRRSLQETIAVSGTQAEAVIPFASVYRQRKDEWTRLWGIASTLAAAILFFVVVRDQVRPPNQAAKPDHWGWTKPSAFAAAPSREAYLQRLADDASDWFATRPDADDPDAFARSLGEFRTGCSRLIVAQHESLPAADRDWLVGRCRKWSASLDDIRARLEQAGPGEASAALDVARGETDALVKRLVAALREQSGKA